MTPRQATTDTRPEKRDHRQEVTDSIIKMLEDGVAPWQKPWAGAGMPLNPTTERAYRGGNAIHLMATGMSRGYEDPRWMTYKQAADNGWQVRKGEKGTHIEFWEVKDRSQDKESGNDQKSSDAATEKNGRRMIHRVYTVFNAKQIDGVPGLVREDRTPFESVQSGEKILANSGAGSHTINGTALSTAVPVIAFTFPRRMPSRMRRAITARRSTNLAHWTGHPSRLDRSTLMESYRFGDLNYAKEELRAELASVFIAAEVGVPHDPANHAAYVGSWIKALKEDKNEICRAAHDASAATDFVLGLQREVSRAEALEVASSQTPLAAESPEQGIDAEVRHAAREEAIREEITTLLSDRELVTENASLDVERTGDQPQRESSQVVARYESDTGTVALRSMTSAMGLTTTCL
jgi:antirestriction protein ArdC